MAHEDVPQSPLVSTLTAGAVAGFVMTAIIYPLDTIKTRLQSAKGFRATGGIRGIYNGFWVLALGSMPLNGIFFLSYEAIKNILESRVPPNHASAVHMCTATFARVLTLLVCVPVEIAKQRQQVYEGRKKLSVISIWIKAYKREGIRHGLYRGFASTLIRDVPFSLIEMPIWELLKTSLRNYADRPKITSVESAVCGLIAGGVAGALTTPVDLIKTRIMLADASGKSLYDNLRVKVVLFDIYAESGVRGLFTGVRARVTMAMFGGFVFYVAYEEVKDRVDVWLQKD